MEILTGLSSSLSYTIGDFYKFMIDNNIVQLGTAFIISTQINQLASKFVENIVSPIIKRLLGGDADSLKEAKFEIIGINFEVGEFITVLIKFMVMMFVLYYVFKFLGKK